MAAPAWYGSSAGPLGAVRFAARVLGDYRSLRRGFRAGLPRPSSWPERSAGVPDRPSDLGWARLEPVRTIRQVLQRGLLVPFTEVMTHPEVSGREWVENLDKPAIIVANHNGHADTPLILYALGARTRDRTVVAAAADYFYENKWRGRLVSLWLNTFPFARMGAPSEVLSRSSQLLKSGWNLVIFPEGSRSPDGRLQPFKPGVGHLATENRAAVVPMFLRGSRRVMPRGQRLPLPAPVSIRIGKPLEPARGETSKAFAARVEGAVKELELGRAPESATGSWIERWRASAPARVPVKGTKRK